MYRFREMVELEGAPPTKQQQQQPPPPPISDMFQKFALAFKTKTYELFAEEEEEGDYAAVDSDCDVTLLLDSAEEFIPHQKVVVIKPDTGAGAENSDSGLIRALIPSLFATLSSFEASYLQFQAAHVPEIDESALELADKSLISILQKLTEMKNLYRESKRKGPGLGLSGGFDFPAASFWEFQVQENQSKLRVLETIVNTQQSQIDVKDDEAIELRKKLDRIRAANCELMRKLGLKEGSAGLGLEVMLTIRVFEAMLRDSVKSMRCFVKLLIDLMRRAGWDLEEAANSVYSGMNYTRKGHFRYAFLSYVCLGMFQNFDKIDFGLSDSETACNNNNENGTKQIENGENIDYLRQLIEHVATNPMEMLSKNPKCEFSRFCGRKYEELIHPTMESSIFSNLDRKDKVLDSWKSLSVFYESFVRTASSIWLLHKLAYSFKPVVEIFQVERGVEFSMVYMEDVLGRCSLPGKARPRVGFTVVPGFKVGRTVVQSQVYLTGLNLKQTTE